MLALSLWLGIMVAQADDPTRTTIEIMGSASGAASTIELLCPNGYRARQTARSRFEFNDLPAGACTAVVTGATRARFRPVLMGETYRCKADATSIYCNAYLEQNRAVEGDADGPLAGASTRELDSAGTAGAVHVMLSRSDLALWGLLTCPGGTRRKATFSGSVAVFADVPPEDCVLSLKGGSPVRYAGVRPGNRIICAPAGTTARCRDSVASSVQRTATPVPARPKTKPPPKPSVPEDALTVVLVEPSRSAWIMVVCPSGFRSRATFVSGEATVGGLPDEACMLSFKGGAPARFHGVQGGQHLTCDFEKGLVDCR